MVLKAFRLVLGLILMFFATFAHAAPSDCEILTRDPMDLLAEYDDRLNALTPSEASLSNVAPLFTEARAAFERALELLSLGATDSKALRKLLRNLPEQIAELERMTQASPKAAPAAPRPVSKHIGDFKTLVPDQLYEVNGEDPAVKRVAFSADVLESVFQNDEPLMQRAAELFRKALVRGRLHATEGSGVFSFAHDNQIFKVKITGDAVGAMRIAGFFDGSDFHIVAWEDESSHRQHASIRLANRVKTARARYFSAGE